VELRELNMGPGSVAEMKRIVRDSHYLGHTSVINDVDSQFAYMPGIDVWGVRANSSHAVG